MSPIISDIIGGAQEMNAGFVRFKILSFKKDNDLIRDSKIIARQFPPYGYVASRENILPDALRIGDLIIFQNTVEYASPYPDIFQIHAKTYVRRLGDPLLKVPSSISFDSDYINPNTLNGVVADVDLGCFYLRNNQYAYGPFRSQRANVNPKTGKSVNKFEISENEVYLFGGKQFLLQPPAKFLSPIDCSTNAQLVNWFKDKLPALQGVDIDTSSLRAVAAGSSLDPLDGIKYRRIIAEFQSLSLDREAIQSLADSSLKFGEIYRNSIREMEEEFRMEYEEKWKVEIKQLQTEHGAATKKLEKIKADCLKSQNTLESLSASLAIADTNKERLINDIRIHAEVTGGLPNSMKIKTLEEQVYSGEGSGFESLGEFISLLDKSFNSLGFTVPYLAPQIMYQFKHKRCFLANNLHLVLEIAKLSRNCKLIIQQVEPDWIKFSYLYNNGLQDIWQSAFRDSGTIHLFVLEDINLSSIECYAKPVLDINDGVRKTLPMEQSAWPENLWLIGLPFQRPQNFEFGLPLIPSTFSNWGFFPEMPAVGIPTAAEPPPENARKLLVSDLLAHDKPFMSVIHEYFPQ